jgi:Fe-S cluster biogenesis protein NfuA
MAEPATPGLSDSEVRERIGELDRLLAYLEQATGPVAESAVAAITALAEVYGTALARLTALAASQPPLLASVTGDEVVSHLLILHGLHPEPAQERAARAVAGIRPHLRSHGGDAELLGIAGGVARIRLSGSCQGCGAPAATLQQAVADAVLTAAPELVTVEPVSGPRAPDLIPAESLLRKPAGASRGSDPP